jgi:phosphatidylserine decarboxylase
MRIHKEGFKIIFFTLLGLLVVNIPLQYFFETAWYTQAVFVISLLLFITVVQFFRHPSRNTPIQEEYVIAPADGKVVVIEEVEETEFIKGKCRQISIFMSPVNVHVNRYPVTGKVVYQKYHPGKYLVAWHPKSSTENERTTVAVATQFGTVLFRQIAGALAKRIVCYAKVGDHAVNGKEFGFIKFGSRVDIYLPLESKVNVTLNQKTVGGETIIAYLN